MRVLIRYLKNENRREETLRALKISLQAWSKSEVTTEISLFESLLLETHAQPVLGSHSLSGQGQSYCLKQDSVHCGI